MTRNVTKKSVSGGSFIRGKSVKEESIGLLRDCSAIIRQLNGGVPEHQIRYYVDKIEISHVEFNHVQC